MRAIILPLLLASLNSIAMGQEFQCNQLQVPIQECTRMEYHPSGPTVTRDLRSGEDSLPQFREISGARSGTHLIGEFRLWQNADRSWSTVGPDGQSRRLFTQNESLPKWVRNVAMNGLVWDIYVKRFIEPVERAGISTESEPKVDLQLVRERSLQ